MKGEVPVKGDDNIKNDCEKYCVKFVNGFNWLRIESVCSMYHYFYFTFLCNLRSQVFATKASYNVHIHIITFRTFHYGRFKP
jgi:hypothetical protein